MNATEIDTGKRTVKDYDDCIKWTCAASKALFELRKHLKECKWCKEVERATEWEEMSCRYKLYDFQEAYRKLWNEIKDWQ